MDAKAIAYGYGIGFNDGLAHGGGGQYLSDMGALKAVIDDGTANLSIILTDNANNDSGEPILTEYLYTYTSKLLTESVTTSTTDAEGNITTNTKSWSKYLIDKLYNASGKLIMQAVYSDGAKGIVSHYLDEDGNKIYLDGGYVDE